MITATITAPAEAGGGNVVDQAMNAAAAPVEQRMHIYQDRSWMWTDGAGYFSGRSRTFTAWSTADGSISVARGRWFPTSRGKVCFRAVWIHASGAARDTTCFSHRIDGTAIYQRREPDGEWYVFDDRTASRGDEHAKLVAGDRASRRYEALRKKLGAD